MTANTSLRAASGTAPAQPDVLIVGAGISAIVLALELLGAGQSVCIVDQGAAEAVGGMAPWAFGGIFFADSPIQRARGIRDSAALAWSDWQATAGFSAQDEWPRRWAEAYVHESTPRVHNWLVTHGVRFLPLVHWVERGLYQPGNSVPRFHLVWGSGHTLTHTLLAQLRAHPRAATHLQWRFEHRVEELLLRNGAVVGVRGHRCSAAEAPATASGAGADQSAAEPFEWTAGVTVIAAGGMGGCLEQVRRHWPAHLGAPPEKLLNGAMPGIDGSMLDASARAGARLTHLDAHWMYAGGIHHPRPRHPHHGLSIVPPRSALWLNHRGRRMGPMPLVASSFDTRQAVERICQEEQRMSWQVMNQRILLRELAVSGSESNPALRDRKRLAFVLSVLRGNSALIADLQANCPDFVQADSLEELAARMNALQGNANVDAAGMAHDIRAYDAQIRLGPKYHNDDQLRRIAQLRQYAGDRVRTCKFQPIEDPSARPYVAIRLHLCTRKTLGGIQTDLHSRVLALNGQPLPGLYAVGEAAGYGGGGMNGQSALEGTFLGGCIYSARQAAQHLGAGNGGSATGAMA